MLPKNTNARDRKLDFGRWEIRNLPFAMQDYERFFLMLSKFIAVAVPAAVVNSGLKFMQKQIQLAFMRRLTHHLHEHYCANRAYYAASVLGGASQFLPNS